MKSLRVIVSRMTQGTITYSAAKSFDRLDEIFLAGTEKVGNLLHECHVAQYLQFSKLGERESVEIQLGAHS